MESPYLFSHWLYFSFSPQGSLGLVSLDYIFPWLWVRFSYFFMSSNFGFPGYCGWHIVNSKDSVIVLWRVLIFVLIGSWVTDWSPLIYTGLILFLVRADFAHVEANPLPRAHKETHMDVCAAPPQLSLLHWPVLQIPATWAAPNSDLHLLILVSHWTLSTIAGNCPHADIHRDHGAYLEFFFLQGFHSCLLIVQCLKIGAW